VSAGLADTSVVIGLFRYVREPDVLPDEVLVSAISMAEIVQGPLFARTEADRRSRERLVLDAQRAFPEPIPFDGACVASYRSVAARTVSAGRHPRRRTLDLLIAATAQAHSLPLYTANPANVQHLADILEIVPV